MAYSGQERRRRQVVVTTNTEYYLRDNVCIAVRDQRTGELQHDHQALGSQIVGRVHFQPDGSWELKIGGAPEAGQRLFFSSHLVTTPVQQISRPGEPAEQR